MSLTGNTPCEGVLKAAVIAVRDDKWGERPMALAIVEPQFAGGVPAAQEEAIRAHMKSYADKGVISKMAIPDRITIVDSLPLTSVGKVDKKALRDMHNREDAA